MSNELEILKKIEFAEDDKERSDLFFTYAPEIEQALHRLESIDNAKPSEALECLESMSNEKALFRSTLSRSSVYMGGEQIEDFSDKSTIGNKFKGAIPIIKQSLLKSQEQEEIVKEYDLKPYELREALLLYVMYKGEYKGNPLPKLKQAQEQEKVLEIIKEKCLTNCNLALVKDNVRYENYCNEFEYFLNKYNESPNGFEITKEDLLTEEEFDLLKETLKP